MVPVSIVLAALSSASRSVCAQAAAAPPSEGVRSLAERAVTMAVPAELSLADLESVLRQATQERGSVLELEAIVPGPLREAALDAAAPRWQEWARVGKPALVERLERELGGDGGMNRAAALAIFQALESLWATEQPVFETLRGQVEPAARPIIDRAESLRAEAFWGGHSEVLGPRFETLDLETTIRGCAGLAGPLDAATAASVDSLLSDYRRDRVRLLKLQRRSVLSSAAESNRIALDAQGWALARQRANPEQPIEPMEVVGLAMAAQLLPTMEVWRQLGELQIATAESVAAMLGPVRGWCVYTAMWDSHPQPLTTEDATPSGQRIAAWIAARQQAGDEAALVRAEAWISADAALVSRWLKEVLKSNIEASARIHTAVSSQPIDFDALAELVAESQREPPLHIQLANERLRSIDRLVGPQ